MKITSDVVVFITGGASGLGEETARHLYNLGAKVCVADMQEDRMILLAEQLGKKHFHWVKCDVTKEEQVKAAIDECVKHLGAIHVALSSAGVAWPCPTLTSKIELNTELFRKVMEINVFGTIYVAKYAAIQMNK